MPNKVAIIDGDSLIFTAFHPNKVLDENKQPIKEDGKFVYYDKTEEEIMASTDYLLSTLLNKCGATHYLLFVKGKGNFRNKYTDTYKADRKKDPPKFWNFTKQYFIDMWGAIEARDVESDDLVNICRLAIPDSFICAIDGDLLGLEGTHYNWKKNEWVTTTKDEAIYKFWSDMICGTHNNTKGIPKIGKVGANKILKDGYFWDITSDKWYREQTFNAYIKHFGEYNGIKEYFTNYISIKLLEKLDGFIIPDPITVKNNNEEDPWEL